MLQKQGLMEQSESSSHRSAKSNDDTGYAKGTATKELSMFESGKNSAKLLDKMNSSLFQCKNTDGVFNPNKVYEMMNMMHRLKDPDAYQPEIVKTIQQKKEKEQEMKMQSEIFKKIADERAQRKKVNEEHDKALFDFDQDIDELDDVAERYPGVLNESDTAKKEQIEQIEQLKDKETEEEPPKPVDNKLVSKFNIKKTERPVFSNNILEDLKKLREAQ